jgi:hypothetical protein
MILMTTVSILPVPAGEGGTIYRALAGERRGAGLTPGEWDDHFRVDAERGSISLITPVGRATVARLKMDSPTQRAARLQWIRLRLFP